MLYCLRLISVSRNQLLTKSCIKKLYTESIRCKLECCQAQDNVAKPLITWSVSIGLIKVSMGAKIRNRYNQVPYLTQATNGKVTNSKLDTTNESQEVSPFPAGDHKAHTNRRAQRHSKHKFEQKHKRSTKETPSSIYASIQYA